MFRCVPSIEEQKKKNITKKIKIRENNIVNFGLYHFVVVMIVMTMIKDNKSFNYSVWYKTLDTQLSHKNTQNSIIVSVVSIFVYLKAERSGNV